MAAGGAVSPSGTPEKASDGSAKSSSAGAGASAPSGTENSFDLLMKGAPPEVHRDQELGEQRESAIEKARADMAKSPADPEPLQRLVDSLIVSHRGDEARTEAQAFVIRQPGIAGGYVALGKALYWNGEYDLALLQFQRAVALLPGARDPAFWQAKVLSATGQGGEAVEILRRLAAREPAATSVWTSLGYQYEEAGNWVEAAKSWEQVAALKEAQKEDNRLSSMRTLLCRDLAGNPPRMDGLPREGLTLPFQSLNGMPAVRVRLNQKVERLLLIDLSSPDVLLVSSVARELQMAEYGGPSYANEEGDFALRPAVAVLESLQAGPLVVLRVPVEIKPRVNYPSLEIGGVLGRRFFRNLLLTVDWSKGTLRLQPAPERPIEGARLYVSQALLTDGRMNGENAGKFLVGTSIFTPGPISALWAQQKLGILPGKNGTRPLFQNNYLYTFTLPEIEIAGMTWKNLHATATDYRSMSLQLQTEITGGLSSAMMKGMKATFDLAHLRLHLERVTPPVSPPAAGPPSTAPPAANGGAPMPPVSPPPGGSAR